MADRSGDTNGRGLSRRTVAKGAGVGAAAAALVALRLGASARPVGAQDNQEDQELLDAWAEAWSSGSGEEVAALFAEDGVYEDVPFEVTVEGRDEIAVHLQAFFDAGRDFRQTNEASAAIPNGFVVQFRYEYTSAATGNSVSYRGVSILEVADGQIARETDYYDQATIIRQEGGTCEAAAAAGTPAAGTPEAGA